MNSSWLTVTLKLIRSWWDVDRIRISPHEGKLWRLQPGNILNIAGEEVEVVSRHVLLQGEGTLELLCRTRTGQAKLQVSSSPSASSPQVWWETESGRSRLHVAEVRIWN